ncbi:hypothetical protein CC86DRAFT_401418 [Ophiobolus disseminans]|uniref:Uncharacterized protein n=1 Tax=Ophiobolus disseminans TaxID=1469910 RepID=A0A6A7AIY3_9PLEO|nr:hypothetical protein CC86DRAFT_401418 [Ophiobolus disseminans]
MDESTLYSSQTEVSSFRRERLRQFREEWSMNSGLLSLPGELRNRIYLFVLQPNDISIEVRAPPLPTSPPTYNWAVPKRWTLDIDLKLFEGHTLTGPFRVIIPKGVHTVETLALMRLARSNSKCRVRFFVEGENGKQAVVTLLNGIFSAIKTVRWQTALQTTITSAHLVMSIRPELFIQVRAKRTKVPSTWAAMERQSLGFTQACRKLRAETLPLHQDATQIEVRHLSDDNIEQYLADFYDFSPQSNGKLRIIIDGELRKLARFIERIDSLLNF